MVGTNMNNADASTKNNTKSAAVKTTEASEARPINNIALAAMLRESAAFVENGEFDPILYQALTDFRTYYKAHLPKKKDDKSRKKVKKKVATTTTTTTTGDKNNEGPTSSSLDATATPTASSQPTAAAVPVPVIVAAAAESTPTVERPASPQDSKQSSFRSDIDEVSRDSGGVGGGVHVASPPVVPRATFTSPGGTTTTTPTTESASPSVVQKHHGTAAAMFGNFKFPKLNLQIPNPAFAATSKKNANRAKADLDEMIAADLAAKAEFSTRRKVVEVAAAAVQEEAASPSSPAHSSAAATTTLRRPSQASTGIISEAGWCEEHFTMGCACKLSAPVASTDTRPDVARPKMTTPTPDDDGSFISKDQYSMTSDFRSSRSLDTFQSHYNNDATVTGAGVGTASVASSNQTTDSTAAVKDTATATTTTTTTTTVVSPSSNSGDASTMQPSNAKPAFQRPVNKTSSLIANGWIEQQRRSKMRFVWKEVLASLVQGTRPGEETTLWIQRETINATTGKKELEALHQIPVKLLEDITYMDYSSDNRFTLKVYNAGDEFTFRCSTDIAALSWAVTLQKFVQEAKNGTTPSLSSHGTNGDQHHQHNNVTEERTLFEEEKKGPDQSPPQHVAAAAPQQPQRLRVGELRAICHGAGINTAGMERSELEAAAEEVRQRGTFFAPPPGASPHPHPMPTTAQPPPAPRPMPTAAQPSAPAPPPAETKAAPPPPPITTSDGQPTREKISISELRAVCHGAGVNTMGMERGELEAAAEEVRKRGTYFELPPARQAAPAAAAADDLRARQEELRKQEELRARQDDLRRQEEMRAHQEELRRRKEQEAMTEKQKREADESRRRQAEEEHRRRMAEEEHRRRMAEQQAEEQRRRYAEQQAAWQQQQQDEEKRRRVAEQQAAEQRRRHEEAMRKQQAWTGSQQQKQQQPQQQQQWSQQQQQQYQQQQWQQQQQQQPPRQQQQQQRQQPWHPQQNYRPQHQAGQHTPPPQQQHQTPPHAQQQNAHSAVNEKYAKMANQNEDEGQAAITRIKHDILIHWALQPPQLQMLRPIDALIATIHKVFPPALGVPAHDYFGKWKSVSPNDLVNDTGLLDEDKLKKAVKKIRFFLHPDKLPKDMNPEQQFMTKMLWDVTSDAWEEFEKRKEDLDWIK